MNPRVRRLIELYARRNRVDPNAALGVASVEGGVRFGAVGDHGTSFGPFQLHVGGALPKGKGAAWANSEQGIAYALQRIGSVAGGLKGQAAVQAIVRRFERPADPDTEIRRAMGHYGKPGASGNMPVSFGGGETAAVGGADKSALLRLVMAQNSAFASGQNVDPTTMTQLLLATRQSQDAVTQGGPGNAGGPMGMGSVKGGAKGGAQAMLQAIAKARSMGLRVGENPYTDHVDPVHVKNSYHYRDFPGLYGGKKLGEAIDVSGSKAQMDAYARWVHANRAKEAELLYDPLGFRSPKRNHYDHVHVAY